MTEFATAADWAAFLRPVAAAVRNTPDRTEFAGRASALAFALRIPPAALTADRQRELCRTCEFWPSIAEVEAVFAAAWRDLARSRAIATSGGAKLLADAMPQRMTADERAACSAKALALVAELSASADAAERPPAAPRTLSPADLVQAYERAGTPAALFRAAQLRRQFAGDA